MLCASDPWTSNKQQLLSRGIRLSGKCRFVSNLLLDSVLRFISRGSWQPARHKSNIIYIQGHCYCIIQMMTQGEITPTWQERCDGSCAVCSWFISPCPYHFDQSPFIIPQRNKQILTASNSEVLEARKANFIFASLAKTSPHDRLRLASTAVKGKVHGLPPKPPTPGGRWLGGLVGGSCVGDVA